MFRCVHGFSSRDSMVRHKGKCLGGGKSVCPACEMVFTDQELLHSHIVKEHQVEGEGCRQQNLMYNHSLFSGQLFKVLNRFEPPSVAKKTMSKYQKKDEDDRSLGHKKRKKGMLQRIAALVDYVTFPPSKTISTEELLTEELRKELRELIEMNVLLSPGGITVN